MIKSNSSFKIHPRICISFLYITSYNNSIATNGLYYSNAIKIKMELAIKNPLKSETCWESVNVSDKTKLNLFGNDSQVKVWRKRVNIQPNPYLLL